MIVSCSQMLDGENAAFTRGVSAADLMVEAGRGIFECIRQFYPEPGTAVLYLGKGNNAGDALVVAKHLLDAGWKVVARTAAPVESFKDLPAKHWQALEGRVPLMDDPHRPTTILGPLLLVDGLLGVARASSPLRDTYAELVREMNELRRTRHASTVAIDLPSGLDVVTGMPGDPCVHADLTVTVAHVKDVLLSDAATRVVGRLAIAPLPRLDKVDGDLSSRALTASALLPALPRRGFDFHKGEAGRVGVVAGSRGFLGAAILAASGALRGGAGLITLYVREEHYALFAQQAPAEVMVKPVSDYRQVLQENYNVLAVGPGLGRTHEAEVFDLVRQSSKPMVLDADMLNMVADGRLGTLESLRAPALLTPHPGEMARLLKRMPELQKVSREEQVTKLAARYGRITWLLKGSRTVIATKGQPISFNTTGSPGMATGGMGDVLTGLCAALIAQGVGMHDAACLGAWLGGRAAEVALLRGQSEESLTPGDVLANLGAAFTDLKRLVY